VSISSTNFSYERHFGNFFYAHVAGEKPKQCAYKKFVSKILMKLTTGLNFTNILQVAFMSTDPKSTKNTVNLSVNFVLLGYACLKAVCKMLVKSTPAQWH